MLKSVVLQVSQSVHHLVSQSASQSMNVYNVQ